MTTTGIIQQRSNLMSFSDIFDVKEKITEFKDDPLVLSCARKEYEDNGHGYLSIDSENITVTDEHRVLAEKIRDYYTKKFFWRALSEVRPLSDYRRRLINLLENRIQSCKDQDCGIYYKLPYFYEEDVVYEEFKKTLKTDKIASLGSSRQNIMMKSLEFIKTTSSRQRKRNQIRYWFKDDNEFLYGIELTSDNPLLPIFNDYLAGRTSILFETRIAEDRIDNMYFYKMFSYKFVKEQNA
jgi:hypothetical protein